MHEDLIKRLRELQAITEHCDEQSCGECENRELCDKHDNKTLSGTYKEAADAIEGLSMKLHGDEAAIAGMKREIERMVVSGNKPRWIPVTEALPKAERKSYWVCTDTGYQCQCRWTSNRFGIGESDEWGWSIFDIPQYQKVVAWMSLPDPYE